MADTYRLRLTYTYSSSTNANNAATAVNNVLAGWTDPVVAQRVTRSGSTLELKVTGLTEAQGTALYLAMNTAAHSVARTAGKYSLVRTPDQG